MNKKLIFVPLAYKKNFSMSANVNLDNESGIRIYLKNAFVLLNSIKKYNPDVQLAVVVNFQIPNKFRILYQRNNIQILKIDFNNFTMPADYKWSLAFFKIKALEYVVRELDYSYYLELDSDEICIGPLDDMWSELEEKILMFVSKFRFNHPTRNLYSKIYSELYRQNSIKIAKTGGGFVAGNKEQLSYFVEECNLVYTYLKENLENLDKNIGDELYTSLYYARYPEKVGDASPYMDVYWTGNFYYTSTNYLFDPVSIIHLPDEKERGLIYIYKYLVKKGELPPKKILFELLSFPHGYKPFSWRRLFIKVQEKFFKLCSK